MSSFFRFAGRTAPSMAATALAAYSSSNLFLTTTTSCEATSAPAATSSASAPAPVEGTPCPPPKSLKTPGFQADAKGYFYDMIPNSQLYQPKLPYPMWDSNWDNKEPTPSGNDKLDRRRKRYLRKHGVTRHIILVRHGQYHEMHKEDHKRFLTELGKEQAHETGKRLAQMLKAGNCNITTVRVSNMARAQETATIIASHISEVPRADPDPLLNEGRPAHSIPCGRVGETTIQKTAEGHQRIEEAFQKYFHRAEEIQELPSDEQFLDDEHQPPPPPEDDSVEARHEYEIIVCHANVIRYFMCRALQLPPEAWLRLCTFNCSLTYLTIRPTGGVSCRLLGDVGHLPPELVSFSGHHGFNW